MKDAFEKLFRAVHQFKKLNVSDLIPGLSSSEFSVMGAILQMGENGKITSSELAAKTKTLPPAVSRTLRGLEEKGALHSQDIGTVFSPLREDFGDESRPGDKA